QGAIGAAQVEASKAKVQKDKNAIAAAERVLGIARLTPEEIEEVRLEAAKIIQAQMEELKKGPETPEARKSRMEQEVKKWARVEIRAHRSGTIVEKNVNVGTIADPMSQTPLFRIGDRTVLAAWIYMPEEYLPLLRDRKPWELSWKIRIDAEPNFQVEPV